MGAIGLAAMVPYFAYQIGARVHAMATTGDGPWVVGVIFLIPLTRGTRGGWNVGAQWRRRGDAGQLRRA
jgi:hypothetical protein